jgi:hypothetical protein
MSRSCFALFAPCARALAPAGDQDDAAAGCAGFVQSRLDCDVIASQLLRRRVRERLVCSEPCFSEESSMVLLTEESVIWPCVVSGGR